MRVIIVFSGLLLLLCTCTQEAFSIKKSQLNLTTSRLDSTEHDAFIKRYYGVVGGRHDLWILLTNWGDGTLTGKVMYPEFGEYIDLEGEVNQSKEFILRERRFKKTSARFLGAFINEDTLRGNWVNVDSSLTLPFELREVVSEEDSLQWTGNWHLNDPWDTCTLIIGNVTAERFDYAMTIYINGYREKLFGTAEIYGKRGKIDKRYMRAYGGETCKFTLYRQAQAIELIMDDYPFLCGLGDNCWIDGVYDDIYRGKEAKITFGDDLKKDIFRTEEQYLSFVKLVGEENCQKFAYNMERIERFRTNCKEENINAITYRARVRGFDREKEGIILYDTSGNIWAARTTPPRIYGEPMSVHYFTNVKTWAQRLPNVIDEWMELFRNCSIVYESVE